MTSHVQYYVPTGPQITVCLLWEWYKCELCAALCVGVGVGVGVGGGGWGVGGVCHTCVCVCCRMFMRGLGG